MMPAVSRLADNRNHPVLGSVLKLASVFCLASMAACVKYLGTDVPAGQSIFVRGSIAMAVIAFIAWQTEGIGVLRTGNWRAHAARSIAGSVSMFCWFSALTMIPLAVMTAISFTIPLYLTVLAMIFLGEKIHWYRWSALAIGFAGVLIIIVPQLSGPVGSALGVGIAMASAILAAIALMFLRKMSGSEHVLTITFYFFLTSSTLALLSSAFGGWIVPTAEQWFVFGLIGTLGVSGQLLMTYSYRYAEASLTAPLDYTTILAAVLFGYYLFDEVPRLATWIGAPLVIASGVIILWREYARHRAVVRAADRSVSGSA